LFFINKIFKENSLGIISVILLIFLYDAIVSFRGLSLTDGWWETYIQFGTDNNSWYTDLGLRLPPLYPLVLKYLSEAVDLNFINLSLIFSFIHSITLLIVYQWIKRFSSQSSALLGVILASAMFMLEGTYNPKDYHTLLFLFVSILLFTYRPSSTGTIEVKKFFILSFVSGFIVSLIILTKHNVGAIVVVGVFLQSLFLIFTSEGKRERKLHIYALASGIVGSVACLILFYPLFPEFINIFFDSGSKGSLFQVFFRFLLNRELLIVFIAVLSLTILIRIINFENLKKLSKKLILNIDYLLPTKYLVLFLIFIIFIFLDSKPYAIIFLTWLLNREKFFSFFELNYVSINSSIPLILALVYAGTMTAGYNVNSLFFVACIFGADLNQVIGKYYGKSMRNALPIILLTLLFLIKVARGQNYSWWFYKTEGMLQKHSNPVFNSKLLENKLVPNSTNEILEIVKESSEEINKNDSIFAFPNIPIVYLLLNKEPVGAPVSWYDVSTNQTTQRTIDEIKLKQPKYIYWMKPSVHTRNGHRNLLNKIPPLDTLEEFIVNSVKVGEYCVERTYPTFLRDKIDFLYERVSLLDIKNNNSSDLVQERLLNKEFLSKKKLISFLNSSKTIFDANIDIFYLLKRCDKS